MSFLSAAILAFVFATNLVILKTDFDYKRIPNAFVLFLFIASLGWHGVMWNNGISVDYARFFLVESLILLGSFWLFWFGLFSAGDAKYFIALSLFATESYETVEFLRNVAIATILFSLWHTAVALLRKRSPGIGFENLESGTQNVPSMKDELIRFLIYSCVVWAFWLWRWVDSDDWSNAFYRLAIFGIGYAFVRTIMRKYVGALVKTEMMKTNLDELTVGTVVAPRYVKRKWNQLFGNDTDFPKALDSLANPLDSQGLDALRRSFPHGTELLTIRTHAFSPVIFTGFVMGFIFWPNTATVISSILNTR